MQWSPKKLVSEGTEPPVQTCSHIRAELGPSQWPRPKSPSEAWLRRCPTAVGLCSPQLAAHCLWWRRHQHLLAGLHSAVPRTSAVRWAALLPAICWNLIQWLPLWCPSINPWTKSFCGADWTPHLHPLPKQSIPTCFKRPADVSQSFSSPRISFSPHKRAPTLHPLRHFLSQRSLCLEGDWGQRSQSSMFQIWSNSFSLGPHSYNSKVLIQTHLWWQLCEPLIGDSCIKPLIGVGSSQAHTWFYFSILSLGPLFKQWNYKKRASLELETFMDLKRNQSESWEIPDTKCLLK